MTESDNQGFYECTNPTCDCHQVEKQLVSRCFLSSSQKEVAFRLPLSRLEIAYEEIHRLIKEGLLSDRSTLNHLSMAITCFREERERAAQRFDFVIKAGIGPGDFK